LERILPIHFLKLAKWHGMTIVDMATTTKKEMQSGAVGCLITRLTQERILDNVRIRNDIANAMV
jgi:hypothetical protein